MHNRQEQKQAEKQEEHYEFHANPVPKDILDKPMVSILVQSGYLFRFIVKDRLHYALHHFFIFDHILGSEASESVAAHSTGIAGICIEKQGSVPSQGH